MWGIFFLISIFSLSFSKKIFLQHFFSISPKYLRLCCLLAGLLCGHNDKQLICVYKLDYPEPMFEKLNTRRREATVATLALENESKNFAVATIAVAEYDSLC